MELPNYIMSIHWELVMYKFIIMVSGGICFTLAAGITKMCWWCVDNWDTALKIILYAQAQCVLLLTVLLIIL